MDSGEDRSQVRTASSPRIMAALRNLAITIVRLAGHASIAAASRSFLTSRATKKTRAPRRASSRAVARPMPVEAPVTNT